MAYLYIRCYNYRHCIQPEFPEKNRNTELPKSGYTEVPGNTANIEKNIEKTETE